jgi:hypothetical protein
MSSNHEQDKAGKKPKNNTDDTTGSDGSSGQGGAIEFRDFVTPRSASRDDNLPPDELKRMLATHNLAHELLVKKQKETRDQRKQVKDGKVTLDNYRQGLASANGSSNYPPHPLLSNKAQFSGIDKQTNPVPTEANTQTNDQNRNELENQYRLTHQPQPQMGKKFNPRPQNP